jgi:hypothetical protein
MAKKSKATRASDSSNGGLQKTEHILGFREPKLELDVICIRKIEIFFLSLHVVLVATNFHVSRWNICKIDPSLVGQRSMATLDT